MIRTPVAIALVGLTTCLALGCRDAEDDARVASREIAPAAPNAALTPGSADDGVTKAPGSEGAPCLSHAECRPNLKCIPDQEGDAPTAPSRCTQWPRYRRHWGGLRLK